MKEGQYKTLKGYKWGKYKTVKRIYVGKYKTVKRIYQCRLLQILDHSSLLVDAKQSWWKLHPVQSLMSSNHRREGLPRFLLPGIIPSVIVFAGMELLRK